eukprot:TRINITY_DN15793_c0_g1_i1.p1 TRINITY_DN15793_c0_g1~~TRINITY_DN15793_c0_g1_i1.p1  ORF type:complete len:164 (-),score=28.09 TRINITY_DN15793_c0_g1_i1:86-577(-)
MDLLLLPEAVRAQVFIYLNEYDLVIVTELTSKKWKEELLRPATLNELWWRLSMAMQWDNKIPKAMTKNEKKKLWKKEFLQLTEDQRSQMRSSTKDLERAKYKQALASARAARYEPTIEVGSTEWKENMRSCYRLSRSKPKSKYKNKAASTVRESEIGLFVSSY